MNLSTKKIRFPSRKKSFQWKHYRENSSKVLEPRQKVQTILNTEIKSHNTISSTYIFIVSVKRLWKHRKKIDKKSNRLILGEEVPEYIGQRKYFIVLDARCTILDKVVVTKSLKIDFLGTRVRNGS